MAGIVERIAAPVCALVRNDRMEIRCGFAEMRRCFLRPSARVVEDADPYDGCGADSPEIGSEIGTSCAGG